jgi:hypothetical protein
MPGHVPPALSPPWNHYLAQIAASTAIFWEERQYPGYARLQGQHTWERLLEKLETILPLVQDPPLSELECFLLFASAYLYEVGWQVNSALSLPPAQRYRESGREIRKRFAYANGRNDLGLSVLKSSRLTVETLARLCELVGDLVDGQDLTAHSQFQQAGNQESARLALLASLFYLADLLLIPRGRDWYLSTIPSFGPQELADARLGLDPYVAYVDLTDRLLAVHYSIHPHDEPLKERMQGLFEEPLKQWWAKNWRWLVVSSPLQLTFQSIPPEMLPVEFESLSTTCPALREFLQTYTPPEILLPSLAQMQALKNTADDRKSRASGERYQISIGAESMPSTPPPFDRYTDFDLFVGSTGQIRAHSYEGDRNASLTLETIEEIALALNLIEKNETSEILLQNLGKKLYTYLFPGPIDKHFSQTEAIARARKQMIRLRLTIEPHTLARLPWELLYRDEGGYFFAVNPNTVLSRYLDVPLPQERVRRQKGPLHMLLILAAPDDQMSLDVDDWEKKIKQALAKPLQEQNLTIQVVKEGTIENINNALLEQEPDIVQFVGHGTYMGGRGYLALVDAKNWQTKLMDDARFASLFLGVTQRLGLICLATCESAKSDASQGFSGMAPQLVQRGIPAVIAMQYKIKISSATLFFESLYRSVAARKSIDWAVQQARNSVAADKGYDNREFATPVLYMRARDGEIFTEN